MTSQVHCTLHGGLAIVVASRQADWFAAAVAGCWPQMLQQFCTMSSWGHDV